jgi:hypothetical protein
VPVKLHSSLLAVDVDDLTGLAFGLVTTAAVDEGQRVVRAERHHIGARIELGHDFGGRNPEDGGVSLYRSRHRR